VYERQSLALLVRNLMVKGFVEYNTIQKCINQQGYR